MSNQSRITKACLLLCSAAWGCASGTATPETTSTLAEGEEVSQDAGPDGQSAENVGPEAERGKEGPAAEEPSTGGAPAPASEDPDGETRTTEAIAAVVKEHRQEVRDCYETELAKSPGLKGDLVIFFVLSPDGGVKEASYNEERSTLKSPAVAACAIEALEGWTFPASSKGMESKVNYPFNLNP